MLKLSSYSGLGSELRRERKSARVTQAELAEKAGVSVPAVRRLERGRGNLDSWRAALAALGLELVGRNLPTGRSLGRRLADLRRRRDLSQRELARLSETSQPTIIALERSERGRLDVLERVGRIIGAGLYLAPKGTVGAFYTHAGNASTHHAWETPKELLEILHSVFGRFDLDPCSPRRTKPPVRARVHFTAEDDGLTLPWHGVVFINPPYGRDLPKWIAKARAEVEAGNSSITIALIPARTDTKAWHDHIAGRAVVYFLRGRLRFSRNGQGDQSAPFPSALVLWHAAPEPEIIDRLDRVLTPERAWRAR